MKNLIIDDLKDVYSIPSVNFNSQTGICELAGDSYLESTAYFYDQLTDWLENFMGKVQKPITFNFKLTYFNTSSAKCIIDILHTLKDYEDQGGSVTVNWYFDETEVDIEDIEDFMEISQVNINIINVNSDKGKTYSMQQPA